jgi:hypothetical protein
VAAMIALAVLGAALSLGGRTDQQRSTIHFVLRPNASVPNRDLPNALDVLKSDGPLVQTVIDVLGSEEMLRSGAAESGVRLTPEFTVDSKARPGSALIDSTLAGPDARVVGRLVPGFSQAASAYVAANYSAYTLDPLGADAGGAGTGLSATQLVVVAVLLGTTLGVGLVLLELRLRPRGQSLLAGRDSWRAPGVWTHCLATTSKGTRCRNRPVDERGYCRVHRARIDDEAGDGSRANGSYEVIRVARPPAPAAADEDRWAHRRRDDED